MLNTTLHNLIEFLDFIQEDWVRLVLNKVHVWLDRHYKITKEFIQRVTRFNSFGTKLIIGKVSLKKSMKATQVRKDR